MNLGMPLSPLTGHGPGVKNIGGNRHNQARAVQWISESYISQITKQSGIQKKRIPETYSNLRV